VKICADVGGSFIDIAVVDENASIQHRKKIPTPTGDWDAFVGVFADFQSDFADQLRGDDPISIAFAGLAAPDTGIMTSANIECIHGRPLARDLAAALGRPVFVINDADAFVLAEAVMGVAQGHRRVFGLILGTGVGGGLIEDGRIVTGPSGIGGEWGHGQIMIPTPKAPDAVPVFECGCGRKGCLDTIGGARGLERLHQFLHDRTAKSSHITASWEAGDAMATATIDYFCDILAGSLAMILNTYPATVVPVGGGLSNSAALIRELDQRVRRDMLDAPAHPILVATLLGGNAGLLGAALAADQ
jgi:N-acetylglucosamine kinase